jgi:hypothetical protein
VNFQMSFGVGAFPFGLFQTTFTTNNTDYNYAPRMYFDKIFFKKSIRTFILAPPGTPERYQHDLLSRVFLGIALAVILFIIFN